MINLELKDNPELLFNKELGFEDYIIDGFKFNDSADLIPDGIIKGTTLEKLPKNATKVFYKNDRVYYFIGDDEFEFTLAEKIKSVKEHGGWLHLYSDFRLRIENKRIEQFAVAKQILEHYHWIPKSEIQNNFGIADKVEKDYDYQHGEMMSTIYHYEKRKIKITYDEWGLKIDWINIGNPTKR